MFWHCLTLDLPFTGGAFPAISPPPGEWCLVLNVRGAADCCSHSALPHSVTYAPAVRNGRRPASKAKARLRTGRVVVVCGDDEGCNGNNRGSW